MVGSKRAPGSVGAPPPGAASEPAQKSARQKSLAARAACGEAAGQSRHADAQRTAARRVTEQPPRVGRDAAPGALGGACAAVRRGSGAERAKRAVPRRSGESECKRASLYT